jgi:hypothetical protein
MKYTVKTVYGISEYHYCGTERHPLAETGHDSRASPAVWLSMICLVIISAYSQSAPKSMKFSDPTMGNIVSTRFVDDTSVGFTSHPKEEQLEPPKMLQLLQDCAQLSKNLLFVSGGALELTK